MDSLMILVGVGDLGRIAVVHLGGPLAGKMYDELFENGWALGYKDGTIYFAPFWAMDTPIELEADLPWTPEVWGVQDGTRWMAMRDDGGEGADLRHGNGSLLELVSSLPVSAEA